MNNIIVYVSDKNLLVHTKEKIIRLNCPFKVKSNYDYKTLQKEKTYKVSLVKSNESNRLLYEINNKFYNYDLFDILL